MCIHALGPGPDGVRCIRVLGGHHRPIHYLYWSQDDDRLFVQSVDNSVAVWMLESGILERRLPPAAGMLVLSRASEPRIRQSTAGSKRVGQSFFSAGPLPVAPESAAVTRRGARQITLRRHGTSDETDPGNGCVVGTSAVPSFHVLDFELERLLPDVAKAAKAANGSSDEAVGGGSKEWWLNLPRNFRAAFCFLHPWGLDAELDNHLTSTLSLTPPSVPVGLAVQGAGGACAAVFPSACAAASPHCRPSMLAGAPALGERRAFLSLHFAAFPPC